MVSYLTPLTGLTAELLAQHGVPLAQALATLRAALPRDAVLVGQNIRADVQWLGLREGEDFRSMLDLAGLWRVYNAQYSSWSVFGQDHLARVLLGVDSAQCAPRHRIRVIMRCEPGLTPCYLHRREAHNAVTDAIKSMRLFNLHNHLRNDPAQLAQAHAALLATQQQPSFARRNPSYDGCCMGNRKTCTCGGTFFY